MTRPLAALPLLLCALGSPLFASEPAPRNRVPKAPVRAVPLPDGNGSFRLTVKFVDAAMVRAGEEQELLALSGADLGPVRLLAKEYDLSFTPLIQLPADRLSALEQRAAIRSERTQPDLAGILIVDVPGVTPANLEEVGARLQELPLVEYAYIQTLGTPPPGDIAPPTPDLASHQTYHGPDPGIDAAYAWSLGVTGAGVRLCDCEYGWVYSHEDLVDRNCHPEAGQTIHPTTIAYGWDEHGTAVLGETSAVVNGYGCSGMAPGADVYTYPELSVEAGYRRVTCITNAIANSNTGDVVLLEMQTVGAGGDYGPAELDPAVFLVCKNGTDAGVVVVGAAGNGNQDLDGASYASYRAMGDSGAIIVGAGSPDVNHDKLSFSTYGARVNVQGWGINVFSIGYGDYAAYGGDPNQYYTDGFSGTSSASPIATSACLLLQEFAVQSFGAPLDPLALRAVLSETGTAQGSGGHIGPLPDLHAAMDYLMVAWTDLGSALAGTAGEPHLEGHGSLSPGTPWVMALTNGRPNSLAVLFVGGTAGYQPLRGGVLVPVPLAALTIATDGAGEILLGGHAPAGLAPGQDFYGQIWIVDPLAIAGAAASNAVTVRVP
ncbi:MAG: S8 family serine peptidase [Planctomycetota bacterium]